MGHLRCSRAGGQEDNPDRNRIETSGTEDIKECEADNLSRRNIITTTRRTDEGTAGHGSRRMAWHALEQCIIDLVDAIRQLTE